MCSNTLGNKSQRKVRAGQALPQGQRVMETHEIRALEYSPCWLAAAKAGGAGGGS